MQTRLHRADSETERRRDLAVGHAAHVLQLHYRSLVRRKRIDRMPDLPNRVERREIGRPTHERGMFGTDAVEGARLATRLAPVDIDRRVLRDGGQPWRGIA